MLETNPMQTVQGFDRAWAYLNMLMGSMISPQVDHLIITNVNAIKKESQAYYGLILKQHQVIYASRAPFKSQVYTLDLKNKTIRLNNKEVEQETLALVLMRIRGILWDLEDKQAKVFEKVKN